MHFSISFPPSAAGKTALQLAVQNNKTDCITILKPYGVDGATTPPFASFKECKLANVQVVRVLPMERVRTAIAAHPDHQPENPDHHLSWSDKRASFCSLAGSVLQIDDDDTTFLYFPPAGTGPARVAQVPPFLSA